VTGYHIIAVELCMVFSQIPEEFAIIAMTVVIPWKTVVWTST